MDSLPSVVPLIQRWEEYVRDYPAGDLGHFGAWLQRREAPTPAPNPPPTTPPATAGSDGSFDRRDQYAGYLIARLYKYVRLHLKAPLQRAGISNIDDWGFLATLWDMKQANKKELITANIAETTTGLDIIRRLIKQKLVEETPDPADGRAKLLSVTEEGQRVLAESIAGFVNLPPILPGLSEQEQTYLIGMLEDLDRQHRRAYEAGR